VNATVITMVGDTIMSEPADEHFARIEAEQLAAAERAQARHVANLLGLSAKHMRHEYIANLARREGQPAADLVRDAFVAAWNARKAAPC